VQNIGIMSQVIVCTIFLRVNLKRVIEFIMFGTFYTEWVIIAREKFGKN